LKIQDNFSQTIVCENEKILCEQSIKIEVNCTNFLKMSIINIQETKQKLYSQQFEKYITNTLLYRCMLKKSVVEKYFSTESSWSLFHDAFTDESYDPDNNYNIMKSEGDPLTSRAVYKYIKDKYPHINLLDWRSKTYANVRSKKFLGMIALKHFHCQYVLYGETLRDDFQNKIDRKAKLLDVKKYLTLYENTVIALCGAIGFIADTYLSNGTAESAVNNLIASYLSEITIPESYEEIKDPKTILKEAYFDFYWKNGSNNCRFSECLKVEELNEMSKKRYKKEIGSRLEKEIMDSTDKFICFGYLCMDNITRRLYAVGTGTSKDDSEQDCSAKLISYLEGTSKVRIVGFNG
jgi:dsRNA-specific ribonuclease